MAETGSKVVEKGSKVAYGMAETGSKVVQGAAEKSSKAMAAAPAKASAVAQGVVARGAKTKAAVKEKGAVIAKAAHKRGSILVAEVQRMKEGSAALGLSLGRLKKESLEGRKVRKKLGSEWREGVISVNGEVTYENGETEYLTIAEIYPILVPENDDDEKDDSETVRSPSRYAKQLGMIAIEKGSGLARTAARRGSIMATVAVEKRAEVTSTVREKGAKLKTAVAEKGSQAKAKAAVGGSIVITEFQRRTGAHERARRRRGPIGLKLEQLEYDLEEYVP